MPNAFAPVDYGQAIGQGTQNALGSLQFATGVQNLRDKQAQNQMQGRLLDLQGRAASGDSQAFAQLTAVSPQTAKLIMDIKSSGDEAAMKQFTFIHHVLGLGAQSSQDPQTWDMTMSKLAQQGIPEVSFQYHDGSYRTQPGAVRGCQAGRCG